MQDKKKSSGLVKIGHIRQAHSLKGDVNVWWNSGECPVKVPPGRVYFGGSISDERFIEKIRSSGKGDLVRFSGVADRTQAEGLRGVELWASRDDFKQLKKDQYYTYQLIGFDCFTCAGERLGKLKEIISNPAHDIYVIKDEAGDEFMIPAVDKIIEKVDLKNKKIIVRMIDGLKDLNK